MKYAYKTENFHPYSISQVFLSFFWITCILMTPIFGISQHDSKIKLDLVLNSDLISSEHNELIGHVFVTNQSNKAIHNLDLDSELLLFQTKTRIENLELRSIEGEENQLLEAGETKIFEFQTDIKHQVGGAWIVTVGASADIDGYIQKAADAKLVYAFGINMDVKTDVECVNPGDDLDVKLITRLLIQEDAAKEPGSIMIGDIEIFLPKSLWEAREMMLTCTDLNGDVEFDPFDPPGGFTLENFCDQGNVDAGRNTNDILDECEPIDTFRDPCMDFGEDDAGCEFPEWTFCYTTTIPSDYMDPFYDIVATDDFELWKADEINPPSGIFGDFVEYSGNNVETGSEYTLEIEVKLILAVEFTHFTTSQNNGKVRLDWGTSLEINNDYFLIERSLDAANFEVIGQLEGAGNSHGELAYSFVDDQAIQALNYYRITQVDYDGTRTHSKVLSEYVSAIPNRSFRIQPNPVNDFFSIVSNQDNPAILNLQIHNIIGELMLGEKLMTGDQISVKGLPTGVYSLTLIDSQGNHLFSDRLLISRD